MLKQFENLSSWREDNITVEPHETYRHYFSDTSPNMMIIVNPNSAVIKIGIGSVPTDKRYEFKVEYNTTEVVGRPIGTKYLYLYNDSSVKANLKVFSINKEFDISALKNMNVALSDLTIETSNIIGGFENGVSLPSGSNNIGNVGLIGEALTALQGIAEDAGTTADKASIINTYMGIVSDNLSNLKSDLMNNGQVANKVVLYDLYNRLSDVVTAVNNISTGSSGIGNMLSKTSLGNHLVSCDLSNQSKVPYDFTGYINLNKYKTTNGSYLYFLIDATAGAYLKIQIENIDNSCTVSIVNTAGIEMETNVFSVVKTPNYCFINFNDIKAWVNTTSIKITSSKWDGVPYVSNDLSNLTAETSIGLYTNLVIHELYEYSGNLEGMHREIKSPLLHIDTDIGTGGTTLTTLQCPESTKENPVKCADAIKTIKCRGDIPVIVRLYYAWEKYVEYTLYPGQEINDIQFDIYGVLVKIPNDNPTGVSHVMILGGFYD